MAGLESPLHIAMVLIVVLLVFGAKRLPEMGKSLGSGLRGFKDSLSGEEHAAELHAAEAHPAELRAEPVSQRVEEPVH